MKTLAEMLWWEWCVYHYVEDSVCNLQNICPFCIEPQASSLSVSLRHLSLSFLCVTWNLPIAGGVVLTNRDKTSKNRQGEYWIWSPSASCLWNSCTEQEQEQKVLMEWADFVLILSSQLQIIIGFLQRLIVMHFCNRSTNWVWAAKHLHVAIVNFFSSSKYICSFNMFVLC